MLKVLIADDHAIVRKGLREILRGRAAETLVGEAGDGLEALALARSGLWDAIVLDITMPGLNGIEVLKQIKTEQPGTPVLMLSMHSGMLYVSRSLKAGALGYLSKETAPEELLAALDAVMQGRVYVSKALIQELVLQPNSTVSHGPANGPSQPNGSGNSPGRGESALNDAITGASSLATGPAS